MAANESSMPFIRNLASSGSYSATLTSPASSRISSPETSLENIQHTNILSYKPDRKIRTSALESLRTFLSASATASRLSHMDNLKLWKGLYYSLWMCDRPIPQQNLCAELAALIDVLPDEAVAPWLAAFWQTMGREWTAIDVLRLEKFMLLVRRVLGASLAWVCSALPDIQKEEEEGRAGEKGGEKTKDAKTSRRSRERIDALLENLASWPLETEDDLSRVPVGLRLHVLDIWIDEAEKLGLLDVEKTGEAGRQFMDRLGLLVEAQVRSKCKPVRLRAKEMLADERLPWNAGEKEAISVKNESGDKDSWDGFDD
ncbi:nucleolar protein,Nop52-domain-containing protein [Xylaria sp. FL1777]|nr:nucleolar protein,Nop52-domain-containing protein [Xylaria sp. FL1777]